MSNKKWSDVVLRGTGAPALSVPSFSHAVGERILLDVDGVIVDFVRSYVLALHAVGLPVVPLDWTPTRWDIAEELHLNDHDRENVDRALAVPGVAASMAALPGAVAGVKALASFADVYFVTAPFPASRTWQYERAIWLTKVFGDELGGKVISTHQKHTIPARLLVDDKEQNCREWEKVNSAFGAAIHWLPYTTSSLASGLFSLGDWDYLIRMARVALYK